MRLLKLVLVLLALGYFGWQLRQLLLGRASQRWRHTRGKVLKSYVDEQVHRGRYGTTYTHSAHVVYTYLVGGRHVESTHLAYEPTTGLSEDAANQLLDGISEGGEVDVFYDPLNWEHAVLIRGSSSGNIVQLALSIAVMASVVWLCFFSRLGA